MPLLTSTAAASLPRITDYRPQELANIAWSFSRLKCNHCPLLHATSSEALPKLTEFVSLNIANTAWAFCVLSDTSLSARFLPPAVTYFLRLEHDAVGTEWVDLVSAATRHGDFLGRDELVFQFEETILLQASQRLGSIVDPTVVLASALREYKDFLDEKQLPHLGPYYTRRALSLIGWLAPADRALWVDWARQEAWAMLGMRVGPLVRTESIVAWVAAELWFHDACVEVSGSLFQAGILAQVKKEVSGLLQSTFRHMARDDHAERAALLHVLIIALDVCGLDSAVLGEFTGKVRLYISHFPCVSCLGVLGQFARLMHSAVLEVAFDDAWEDD